MSVVGLPDETLITIGGQDFDYRGKVDDIWKLSLSNIWGLIGSLKKVQVNRDILLKSFL